MKADPLHLVKLAGQEYGQLTSDETEFLQRPFETLVMGTVKKRHSVKPEIKRMISGQLIRWLCISEAASAAIGPRGLSMCRWRIVNLDLEDLTVPFSIVMDACELTADTVLRDATTKNLIFSQCTFERIEGDRVNVAGILQIFDCQINNGISLSSAHVTGGFHLEKSNVYPFREKKAGEGAAKRWREPQGIAVDLSMARLDGLVSFRWTRVWGELVISIAKVGGDLSFVGGTFWNGSGLAIDARQNVHDGSIDFDYAKVRGIVILEAMKIRGKLSLRSVFIKRLIGNKAGRALLVGRSRIGSDVLVTRSFITGDVDFGATEIEGSVELYGTTLTMIHQDDEVDVLNFSAAVIKRSIVACMKRNEGTDQEELLRLSSNAPLCFRSIHIQRSVDLRNCELRRPADFVRSTASLDFSSATVVGEMNLDGLRIDGEIALANSSIGSDLSLLDVEVSNEDGRALFADGIKVGGCMFLRGTRLLGHTRMVNGRIASSLECESASFLQVKENPHRLIGQVALEASFLRVGASLFLENVTLRGKVILTACEIGVGLYCDGNFFEGPGGVSIMSTSIDMAGSRINGEFRWNVKSIHPDFALSLEHASVSHLNLRDLNVGSGRLNIKGFTYQQLGSVGSIPFAVSKRERKRGLAEDTSWLMNRDDQFSFQPFLQLASVLKNDGRELEAVNVKIAGKRRLRKRMPMINKVRDYIYDLVIGYGYKPFRALWFAIFFISVGAYFFRLGAENGSFLTKDGNNTVRFVAWAYSIDAFFPFVDFRQEVARVPDPMRKCTGEWFLHCGWLLSLYYWVHVSVGWFISFMFIAGVTGLMKKE